MSFQAAVEATDTLVIGAGPAGLAVGACLKRAAVPFRIIEREPHVGASWRRRYKRLHLHTDRAHSELPYLGFPRGTQRYPSRVQVIEYLEEYARHFQLEPQFGETVRSVKVENGVWQTKTDRGTYRSPRVVVATGFYGEPHVPSWSGQERFGGPILHSSVYEDGEPFRGQRVLVVGLGNSGGEIAIDLFEHGARPALVVRGPINVIPREVFGLPVLAVAIPLSGLPPRVADILGAPLMRLTLGDIRRLGFRKLPYGPMVQIVKDRRVPVIDVGTLDLLRAGHAELFGDIRSMEEGAVIFQDGRRERFDALVLATGFRLPRVASFIAAPEGVLDAAGTPRQSGVALAPGLYFCGYRLGTGMLREIALEARRIATDVAKERRRAA
jgi:cation diffusion facilitator CzcD-associated flavoprotein CzcO